MKKALKFMAVFLFACTVCAGLWERAYAADYNEVIVEGGYRFLLYYTKAIQGYAPDGDDIYIQQAYSENEFDEFDDYKTGRIENLILISRCRYSPEYDAYMPEDYMLLKGVGHGQTISAYSYKDKKYLLVSCGGKSTSAKNLWWSTQIGRIEYKAGGFVNNDEIKRLTYINYSAKKEKRFGTTMRADASLTPDKKILVIWKMNEKGQSQYSAYDFLKVNKEFDRQKKNDVNMKKNKNIKKAFIFATKPVKLDIKSFQGFALSDKTKGKYTLYISSGDERHYRDTGISIYKYEIKGNKIKRKAMVKLNAEDVWNSFPADDGEDEDTDEEEDIGEEEDIDEEYDENEDEYVYADEDKILAEIEDMKIIGKELQFVVRNTGNSDQQLLCTISINEF